VKRVLTLDGYPLFLLVALNGTEQPLSALTKQIGGRRQISVGPIGVFVVRPDDVGKLISSIAA
jgi:hypothetical protein